MPSLVRFGQLLDPIKFNYFLKKKSAKKSKFPCEISSFFVRQLGKPFFSHYILDTTGSMGYQFGSLSTTVRSDKI